jgi:putative transposase
MEELRSGSHSVYQLPVPVVGSTNYRFDVLKGVVTKDHIHLHLNYPPWLRVSDVVKRLKGLPVN